MSAPRWRRSLIGVGIAFACLTFFVIGSMTAQG
jgi:hypothetical protein